MTSESGTIQPASSRVQRAWSAQRLISCHSKMRITLPSGVRPAHTSCTAETPSRDEFMSNWINLRLVDMRSLSGAFLPWLTEIKYLGVHIVESKSFIISADQSRRSLYRAANAIFARVGRIA